MKRVKKFALILAEFFPVVVGLFYFIYTSQFLQFSNTFLGKLVFLIFVVIYTYIDKTVGTFFALLYIVYYQSDLVEHFEALNNYPEYHHSIMVDPKNKMISTSFGGTQKESKENFVGGLDDISQKFVRENCKNGNLTATPGSFSMGFGPDGKCNPCDRGCWFYMLESKLSTEEKVIYPKESNAWYDKIVGTESNSKYEGFTSKIDKGVSISPTTGVISEAFSKWKE